MSTTPLDPYEVYAIRYATVQRRASENFLGGDPHEVSMRMDYFVWLIRGPAGTFVVDTGFNQVAAQRRKRELLRCPRDGLRLLGVEVGQVEQVILTHLHYDHAGNLDLFPKARFHLQDTEMSYATGRYMAHAQFALAYEADDVVTLLREVYKGRVAFHDGDAEIAPGLSLHHIGGHTLGLQSVRVWTRIGWLVIASDAAHYYTNMNDVRPFPIVVDVARMVDGYRRLRELASAPRHVVPGHDPLVMQRYRAPNAAMQGIVARLDDEPTV
ncbi:MAG: N-acyl homoserine lactonase family protein [Burkholderiales bacterium]